jgi:hypothetical protein
MKDDFAVWMEAVDREIENRCFLSADDLPDQPYRDWFDCGLSPKEAAVRAIRNASDDYTDDDIDPYTLGR